jgi:hypothetical protein
VFESKVLRRVLGRKREEKTGIKIMHNEELCELYSSPNIIRMIKSKANTISCELVIQFASKFSQIFILTDSRGLTKIV